MLAFLWAKTLPHGEVFHPATWYKPVEYEVPEAVIIKLAVFWVGKSYNSESPTFRRNIPPPSS
jgi:hypothetical protein